MNGAGSGRSSDTATVRGFTAKSNVADGMDTRVASVAVTRPQARAKEYRAHMYCSPLYVRHVLRENCPLPRMEAILYR